MGFQSIIIEGNLGRDPEVRYTPAGKTVCNFSVAVSEGFGDKKATTWFSVVAWEKTAEACGKYLQSGSKVLVQGRMQERKYQDRDGNERKVWDLVANRVEFLGGTREGQQSEPRQQQRPPKDDYAEPPFDPSDGIPF